MKSVKFSLKSLPYKLTILTIDTGLSLKAHLDKTTSNLVSVNLSDTAELQAGIADSTRTNTPT